MLKIFKSHPSVLAWYEAHYAELYEYGRAVTGDPALVQDLLQELFTWLLDHPASVAKVQEPKGYLMRSLHNNIRKHYHGVKRGQKRHDVFAEQPRTAQQESVEEQIALQEREALQREVLKHCLAELTPRQREIVYLRYYRNLPYAEIAEMLGIQEQVARNTNSRALKNLRQNAARFRDHCYILLVLLAAVIR